LPRGVFPHVVSNWQISVLLLLLKQQWKYAERSTMLTNSRFVKPFALARIRTLQSPFETYSTQHGSRCRGGDMYITSGEGQKLKCYAAFFWARTGPTRDWCAQSKPWSKDLVSCIRVTYERTERWDLVEVVVSPNDRRVDMERRFEIRSSWDM